jgi:hypothetical protein
MNVGLYKNIIYIGYFVYICTCRYMEGDLSAI